MRKTVCYLILSSIFCLSFLIPLFAETITLKSGKKVEGKILEKTTDHIKIDISGIAITYYTDEVASIDNNGSAASTPKETSSFSSQSPKDIFKNISPAVVYITTKTVGEEKYLGSGFIVDKDGIGVTNYHVVQFAKEINVKLKSGETYPVTDVIYFDASRDVFIFKINAHNLTPVTLGNSNQLEIGETLYCIGNPLGLEYSFTNGMLSATRDVNNLKYLQFSAPVSAGNSGGPLLNPQGEVVGIVTFLMPEGQNLNFALSINEIKPFISTNPKMTFTEFTKNVSQADYYYIQGLTSYLQGNFPQAISDYTKAIETNPNFAIAYSDRGQAYFEQGNFPKAISDFNKAIEIDPNHPNAYYNRGIVYYTQGNIDRAISDYDKAISINPKDAQAYANRGAAYSEQDNFSKAISDCNKAIEINPNDAASYNNRGVTYKKQGSFPQAISDYNKAVAIDPKLASAYNNLAVVYFFQQEYDKAWQGVHKAIELGGQVNPEFLEKLKKASRREK